MSALPIVPVSYGRAGTVLIVLGLAIPALATAFGKLTAFEAGNYTARAVGSLLFLALVAWLATRKLGTRAKANGRIVVGVVLCAVVLNNVYSVIQDTEQVKAYLVKAMEMQKAGAAKFQALNERFEKLPISSVLTPENVTTSAGRAAGKATVAQLRALVAERKSVFNTYLTDLQSVVDSLPSATAKRGAMAGMEETLEPTKKIYADLERVQSATADSIDAILNWCAAQGNTLQVRNKQLLFATAVQQAQMQALLAKLDEVAREESKVLAQVQASQVQAAQRLERSQAEVAEFLKR